MSLPLAGVGVERLNHLTAVGPAVNAHQRRAVRGDDERVEALPADRSREVAPAARIYRQWTRKYGNTLRPLAVRPALT
jgi:hypothetical protein